MNYEMAKRNTLVKTKVGVCDADPAMQRLLLRLLKKEGYETVRVASHSVIEKVLEEQRLHIGLNPCDRTVIEVNFSEIW